MPRYSVLHRALGWSTSNSNRALWPIAIAICLISILLGGYAGYQAYRMSRASVVNIIAQDCLNLSRSFASYAHRLKQIRPQLTESELYSEMSTIWNSYEPAYPGSYLCVVKSSGELATHSKVPDYVGTQVDQFSKGQNITPNSEASIIENVLADHTDWAGENTSLLGIQQIAGYAYQPDLQALVIVHVPTSLIESHISKSVTPWTTTLLVVLGLLLPIGIVLITYSHRQALVREKELVNHANSARDNFYHMLQTIPHGVYEVELDGRVPFFNDALCELFGLSRNRATDYFVWEFFSTETEQQQIKHMLGRVVEDTPTPFPYSFRKQTATGETIDILFHWDYLRDSNGDIIGLVAVATNVTEREKAFQLLKESEERFRRLVDGLPQLVWMCGTDKKCYYFNRQWLDHTGRTLEQEYGNGWMENVHPEDLNFCIDEFNAAFDARQSLCTEYRMRGADGQYRWFLDNGIPWFDEKGEFAGYIGSCIDVTERKQAESQLVENANLLSHTMRLTTLGEMAAGVVHEIGQPLHAISTFTEASRKLIKSENGFDSSQLSKWLSDIAQAASQSKAITTRLKSFARRSEPKFDYVTLDGIIRDSIQLVTADFQRHSIDFHKFLENSNPTICVDPVQIQQVLVNLLRNSIDAMEDTPVESRRLELHSKLHGRYLQISVKDFGSGLPDSSESVFKSFFSTKPDGLGIGLSISRTIVEAHGGTLKVVAPPDAGAIFILSLPLDMEAL